MTPDWRYNFEADGNLDADHKKWSRWKAQGRLLPTPRRSISWPLVLALLGLLGLVSYVLAQAMP